MTSFNNIFGGTPINPAFIPYRSIAITTSPLQLNWPNSFDTTNVVAALMEVTPSAANQAILMPPANQGSVPNTFIFRNLGASAFTVEDTDGHTIVSIAPGAAWYVYIVDSSTADGVWHVLQFGTGTSSADAASLAGLGLVASAGLLNQSHPVSMKNANYTFSANDRAQVIANTGGAVTFTLLASGTLGNSWFTLVKNAGTGTLTITGQSGDLIDGQASITLNPEESTFIICTGATFYSVGLGRSINTSITRLVKSVAGSANVTLTSTEAAFSIIEFTGALTGNINVIVPTSVNQWTFKNGTTGAFTLTVKTASGTGITIPQGNTDILYCDGTNVVVSQSASAGTITEIDTGTGLTGGPITSSGTVALANTAVTAGSYGGTNLIPVLTIDPQGRVTSASSVAITEADIIGSTTGFGTGNLVVTGGATPTAGNIYDVQIVKTGTQELAIGINKHTATSSVPADAAFISTFTSTGKFTIGRGNSAGDLNTVDLLQDGTGNISFPNTVGGPNSAARNKIINGNFEINQRVVTSPTTLSAGVYGHDRWKAGTGGCTYSFATTGSDTLITITAGSISQAIEGININTTTYIMSWTGTAQGRIVGGTYANSPVNLTATAGSNLSVEFGTGTLGLIQIEVGTNVNTFERRLIGEELLLCQRYYQKSYPMSNAAGTANHGGFQLPAFNALSGSTGGNISLPASLPLKATLRTSPTTKLYNFQGTLNSVSLSTNTAGRSGASISVDDSGYFQLIFFDSSSSQAVAATDVVFFGWSCDSEI